MFHKNVNFWRHKRGWLAPFKEIFSKLLECIKSIFSETFQVQNIQKNIIYL